MPRPGFKPRWPFGPQYRECRPNASRPSASTQTRLAAFPPLCRPPASQRQTPQQIIANSPPSAGVCVVEACQTTQRIRAQAPSRTGPAHRSSFGFAQARQQRAEARNSAHRRPVSNAECRMPNAESRMPNAKPRVVPAHASLVPCARLAARSTRRFAPGVGTSSTTPRRACSSLRAAIACGFFGLVRCCTHARSCTCQ
jgi:hypothetical protein